MLAIPAECNLPATAFAAGIRYVASMLNFQTRELTVMAYVVSEGRLLSLKPFEWLMLLVGGMLCGSLTRLF
jgi:hypothetical protein